MNYKVMTQFAIRVESVSKRYRIGGQRQPYQLLRDRLGRMGRIPFRGGLPRAATSSAPGTFLALDDVTFDVAPGEVVGVIGGNGAGKSTLLKILSRIAEPTKGTIDLAGRVGSLLEVGTGFHPELTGRENIYLNGAVLGMRRREIDRKLDEIIAFAEVERFVDMPVKHYSSGMYLRLAFAVAAHLEPDILLVDEVLAVGDIAFQKKCVGKMNSVAKHGRTVLFVSHNLAAVKDLCASCVVLTSGKIAFRGPVPDALAVYTRSLTPEKGLGGCGHGTRWAGVAIELRKKRSQEWLVSGEPFSARARLIVAEPMEKARLYCLIDSAAGDAVVHSYIDSADLPADVLQPGEQTIRVAIPPLWLVPDGYSLYFKLIGRSASHDDVKAVSDRILLDLRSAHGQGGGKVRARLIPPLDWSCAP